MKKLLIPFLTIILLIPASARTWTSSDGRSLEAEFISSTGTHVTLKKDEGGQRFTLLLSRLSQADQDWIVAQSEEGKKYAKLPKKIAEIVKERGKLIFEDDFNREDADEIDDLGMAWETNSKNRAQGDKQTDLVEGVLVMTISPKADHAISVVHNTSEPYGNVVTYVKMKLEEGEQLKLAFNDKQFKEVHAGHINGVTMNPSQITLADEREGRFSAASKTMKGDASKKPEMDALIAKTEKRFKIDLKTGEWHDVVTIHDGSVLTAFIDGDEVGSFEPPGFSHATKRQFVFAVPKGASVDEAKLWKLE